MLLLFGSALVLAGIIFFFAYNWAAMGKFLKFGLIEAGIIVCIVASHLRGRTDLSGKVLLLSGAVLVGVLLAVYGQIYQTGADAYGLFICWAVLIFGWVIISEFAALCVFLACLTRVRQLTVEMHKNQRATRSECMMFTGIKFLKGNVVQTSLLSGFAE